MFGRSIWILALLTICFSPAFAQSGSGVVDSIPAIKVYQGLDSIKVPIAGPVPGVPREHQWIYERALPPHMAWEQEYGTPFPYGHDAFESNVLDRTNVPLARMISDEYEQYMVNGNVATSIRPFRFDNIGHVREEHIFRHLRPLAGNNGIEKAWNYIAYNHFAGLEKQDFSLFIDPLVDFSVGRDFGPSWDLFTNTRGGIIKGRIGQEFSFETTFRENQARLPLYLQDFVGNTRVVPGQGRIRRFKEDSVGVGELPPQIGLDYAQATGYISWTPSRFVNFQFGQGKNFFGDGYRSLLLSDNTFSYPYFKIHTQFWKIDYVNLYTQFQDLTSPASFISGFQKKFGSFHYLNYTANKWLQIGLFEGVVWQGSDSTNTRGFDMAYLNPVIFFRPVEFGLGSPDNAILGANIKVSPWKQLHVYGQFVLDDLDIANSRRGEGFYRNKMGWQAGVKWFRVMDIENLVLRMEYNQVKPFTYAHKIPVQNYAHFNQALAHPLGANFREFIGSVSYRYRRVYGDISLQHAVWGSDSTNSHVGQNIFVSDFEIDGFPESFGNFTTQGVPNRLNSMDLRVGYIIAPVSRMSIEVQARVRGLKIDGVADNTTVLRLSLRTNVFSRYYDF